MVVEWKKGKTLIYKEELDAFFHPYKIRKILFWSLESR